jgi:adenosylcobinamide-GDP ribazoletransferase
MKNILIALSFLTIIPIKFKSFSEQEFKNSIKYFPVIGLLLGFLFYIVTFTMFDYEIKAVIILFLWILLTGGFHLDGVADVFDAIGSVKDREKAFQIMKDSRVGAIGVISLIFLILSKFVLIKHIMLFNPVYILLPPVAGRFSINFLSWKLDYAKEKGLGKSIVEFTDNSAIIFSCALTLLIFLIINIKLFFLFIDLLFFLYLLSLFFKNKFNGVTGDMLGLSVEVSELFILLGGLFFVN